MPEADLFDLPDPSRRLTDPRNTAVKAVAEATVGIQKMSSVDEAMRIFRDEVSKDFPDAAKISEFKEKGHRYRVEDGRFVVENLVTKVTEPGFRRMIRALLDVNNEGSPLHTLRRSQGNGVWVPVACAIRQATHAMNDRKVPLPAQAGEIQMTDAAGGAIHMMLPVPVEVLEWRIQLVDAAGADDIKYDALGRPVADAAVKVQQSSDPALADAISRLAESLAPTPTAKPAEAAPTVKK